MFKRQKREVLVSVAVDRCTGCGKCVKKCRNGAMQLRHDENGNAYAWNAFISKCTGCGKCERVCRQNAISISEFSAIIQPIFIKN